LLIKVIPREKRLITVLLEVISEAEEKIKMTADVLRQHGRIIYDRARGI
jgi:hypothetical protein